MSELLSIMRVLTHGRKNTPPQSEKLKYLDIANQIHSISKYTRNDDLHAASGYLSNALTAWHTDNSHTELNDDPFYKIVIDALEKLEQLIDLFDLNQS